jgi:hypothetical protein
VRRRRPWLSATQKAEAWRRWRQGESLQTIGRALGWATKCMHYVVAESASEAVPLGHAARALRQAVSAKLALEWSPQQIAGWLRHVYPDNREMHMSHETIYLRLFVQSRGVLKKALMSHLRQRRTYRRPKNAAAHPGGYIVDAVSIRERPATVEDRAIPGHWEGDLLAGAPNSHIATLVERSSIHRVLQFPIVSQYFLSSPAGLSLHLRQQTPDVGGPLEFGIQLQRLLESLPRLLFVSMLRVRKAQMVLIDGVAAGLLEAFAE